MVHIRYIAAGLPKLEERWKNPATRSGPPSMLADAMRREIFPGFDAFRTRRLRIPLRRFASPVTAASRSEALPLGPLLEENGRLMAAVRWLSVSLLALSLAPAARASEDPSPGFVLQGEGGLVTAFALDPTASTTLYAATGRGLYKTTDGGNSWLRTGAGLRDRSVLAIAVDPASPSNLYATTDTAGVFRSEDGGEHWREANRGIAARYVGAIAIDPHHGGVVYAGAEAGRVFRSEDSGETWTELASPTTRVSVTVIVEDPKNHDRLFVGTNSEGVFWSVDGGRTWARPSGRLSRGTVWNLAFDPASDEMFAGTHDGLFRSADHGRSWLPTNTGLRSWNILTLVTHPDRPDTLYAGTAAAIYRSVDRGRTWTEMKNDLYVTALAIDPRSPSTLYAATHLGVLKSETSGTQWKALRMAPSLSDPLPAEATAGKASAAPVSSLPALPQRRPPSASTAEANGVRLPALPVKAGSPATASDGRPTNPAAPGKRRLEKPASTPLNPLPIKDAPANAEGGRP